MISPENLLRIEIIKLIVAFLTPILILVLGLLINKSIEKSKKNLLQEKEWQVRWAETFLTKAILFEENISKIVNILFRLQEITKIPKTSETKIKEVELITAVNESIYEIRYLGWDIQNFAQFAEKNCKNLILKQTELSEEISKIFETKQGDLEKIRKIQFDYNKLVRIVHNEILNTIV
jgi:hypothetical protein